MRDENALNKELSRRFRQLQPAIMTLKISDRFSPGISDYLLFGYGRTLAMEVKFVKKWPKPGTALLKHVFDGPQLTFLESVAMAGHRSVGLVAVEEAKAMYTIPHYLIPASGNWLTQAFRDCTTTQIATRWPWLGAENIAEFYLENGL